MDPGSGEPARRMASDFSQWGTTECSWPSGSGSTAGGAHCRRLNALMREETLAWSGNAEIEGTADPRASGRDRNAAPRLAPSVKARERVNDKELLLRFVDKLHLDFG